MKQTEMFYKIQIRDYGIGIRDGEENKIFQRFYRGEQARRQEGCGIGLYLSCTVFTIPTLMCSLTLSVLTNTERV